MKIKTAIILLVIILAFIFLREDKTNDELFLKIFNEMADSANKKNLEEIMDHFSLHYTDEFGANYFFVKSIIEKTLQRYDSFEAEIKNLTSSKIEEEGNKQAIVNADFQVFGIKRNIPVPLIGTENGFDNITITFNKTKLRNWKIKEVEGLSDYDKNLY